MFWTYVIKVDKREVPGTGMSTPIYRVRAKTVCVEIGSGAPAEGASKNLLGPPGSPVFFSCQLMCHFENLIFPQGRNSCLALCGGHFQSCGEILSTKIICRQELMDFLSPGLDQSVFN